MVTIAKVTRANQITLPKKLRDELSLQAGDLVSMERKNGGILVKRQRLVDDDEAWLESEWVEAAIREGEADMAAGRGSGPFATPDELRAHLRGLGQNKDVALATDAAEQAA